MKDLDHLHGFGERRPDMGAALSCLEDALARPIGAKDEWRSQVGWALDDVATVGRVQIGAMIGPGGPLEDAVRDTPRLSGPVAGLRRELPEIEIEAEDLPRKLDVTAPAELRRQLLPFLGRVVRIRQSVADVVWEAYSVDIGGGG
jgi:hypothetical protein